MASAVRPSSRLAACLNSRLLCTAFGALAYDSSQGFYMFENDTSSDATVWTVASKAGARVVFSLSWT